MDVFAIGPIKEFHEISWSYVIGLGTIIIPVSCLLLQKGVITPVASSAKFTLRHDLYILEYRTILLAKDEVAVVNLN